MPARCEPSRCSRLEDGAGARDRVDTLARVATALGRHVYEAWNMAAAHMALRYAR